MTKRAQIKCVNKQPRNDPYDRITHVGGNSTKQWRLTLDDAIGKIERLEWEFFTKGHDGHEQKVIVVRPVGRDPFLRTEADHDTPDNLLSLPECP